MFPAFVVLFNAGHQKNPSMLRPGFCA